MVRPIKKLLVANRSEIAIRVFRSAHELGIRTVAIYAHEDRFALHRFKADESYLVGRAGEPIRSYLDIAGIVALAKAHDVDAIHPGYGFLSENPEFASACLEAGITFVGPRTELLETLGDKTAARDLAKRAGVPILAGSSQPVTSQAEALQIAKDLGWPVILKAAHGGGGRGMRVVRGEDELAVALESAQRESKTAFGSAKVFVEKFIQHARHIEVQLLGDMHGGLVHLFERDCSVQRRHQKVIEEAPAPDINRRVLSRVGDRCAEACRRINYRGAGTFEFLYENGEFYFIEMNTRVQVEHPVTEFVTGIDIVQAQIRIAAGEKLWFKQRDIELRGHAIECRINAEDPFKFTPSPGKITNWHPPGGPGIRVDSHAYSGYTVPPHYDSMIGKVIAYGDTREQAIRRMRIALSEMMVDGIKTNIPLHQDLMLDERFIKGGTSIHYLEEKLAARNEVTKGK